MIYLLLLELSIDFNGLEILSFALLNLSDLLCNMSIPDFLVIKFDDGSKEASGLSAQELFEVLFVLLEVVVFPTLHVFLLPYFLRTFQNCFGEKLYQSHIFLKRHIAYFGSNFEDNELQIDLAKDFVLVLLYHF